MDIFVSEGGKMPKNVNMGRVEQVSQFGDYIIGSRRVIRRGWRRKRINARSRGWVEMAIESSRMARVRDNLAMA